MRSEISVPKHCSIFNEYGVSYPGLAYLPEGQVVIKVTRYLANSLQTTDSYQRKLRRNKNGGLYCLFNGRFYVEVEG